MSMLWAVLKPHDPELLGLLPQIFDDEDPRSAAEQANDRYAHGGGWHPTPGWRRDERHRLFYPGDQPLELIAGTVLRDEKITVYNYGWVCIEQPDGTFEVSRMD